MDIRKFVSENITRTKLVIIIAAVVLVAAAVVFALDPSKQLEKMRNDQRRSDAALILDALYQYLADNGKLPVDIPESPKEICKAVGNCTGLIDLNPLVNSKKYLTSIPADPRSKSANGTGYQISRSASGRITISAIQPEGSAVIAVTR